MPLDDVTAWVDSVWREAMRPPPLLTVSEWADRYRRLFTKAAAEPGHWRTDRIPYLRGIMDALSPHMAWERVVFVKVGWHRGRQ